MAANKQRVKAPQDGEVDADDLPDLSVADQKFLEGLLKGLNASDALRREKGRTVRRPPESAHVSLTIRSVENGAETNPVLPDHRC